MGKQVGLNFQPLNVLPLARHLRIELTQAYLSGPSVFVNLLI